MVVGSLLLIVVAVALLVMGLLQGANALFVASTAASLMAAIVLIASGRQAAAARVEARHAERVRGGPELEDLNLSAEEMRRSERAGRQPVGARVGPVASSDDLDDESVPQQEHDDDDWSREAAYVKDRYVDEDRHDDEERHDDGDRHNEDPEDEPPAQQTSPADAARVATMSTDVHVIDGRPRYHLRGCVHMLGRESEPLPVSEAIELGFTPCSICEPDRSLLAESGRGLTRADPRV